MAENLISLNGGNKMEIKPIGVQQIYETQFNKTEAVKTAKPVSGLGADTVTISDEAKDIMFAQKVLAGIPDIRQDKVDALKRAMDAGSYALNMNDVAAKMLGL